MRLDLYFDVLRTGRSAECATESGSQPCRLPELLRQLNQRIGRCELHLDVRLAFSARPIRRTDVGFRCDIGGIELTASLLEGIEQNLSMGKVAEQSGEVRERLVKGWHVNIGRLGEVFANAVDDCVGRLVGDDIV